VHAELTDKLRLIELTGSYELWTLLLLSLNFYLSWSLNNLWDHSLDWAINCWTVQTKKMTLFFGWSSVLVWTCDSVTVSAKVMQCLALASHWCCVCVARPGQFMAVKTLGQTVQLMTCFWQGL